MAAPSKWWMVPPLNWPIPPKTKSAILNPRRKSAAAASHRRDLRTDEEARITGPSPTAARPQVHGRVLVVDDGEIFQQVGASLVSEAQGLHLVGVAASGEEAIRLLPELKPDLVLLDVHMPGLGGLETARVIRRESPQTVVVLVSVDPMSVPADTPSRVADSPASSVGTWAARASRPTRLRLGSDASTGRSSAHPTRTSVPNAVAAVAAARLRERQRASLGAGRFMGPPPHRA